MNDIITIIQTIGFPCAACCAMAWYVKYITDKKNNDKVAVKISSRKRQSARNTQKQNIYKDIDNEGID